jgi:uncharacterized ion transporter superfamily protein YfcC
MDYPGWFVRLICKWLTHPRYIPPGAIQPPGAVVQRSQRNHKWEVWRQDETGYIDVWNYGSFFVAIDVAMFELIIGGYTGMTMNTGTINEGITCVVSKLKGKEKWSVPILMVIFAISGISYRIAEETLAFYALIITVMLAAGYNALSTATMILLGAGIDWLSKKGTFDVALNKSAQAYTDQTE